MREAILRSQRLLSLKAPQEFFGLLGERTLPGAPRSRATPGYPAYLLVREALTCEDLELMLPHFPRRVHQQSHGNPCFCRNNNPLPGFFTPSVF